MPKRELTKLFLSAAARKSAAASTPPLATRKKRLSAPFRLPSRAPATEPKPAKAILGVSSNVLLRLKRAAASAALASAPTSVTNATAGIVTTDLECILEGSSDAIGLPSKSIGEQPDYTLDIPWFLKTSGTCTSSSGIQIRKEVTRERKQKYVLKNTESRRYTKLMRMCAERLGTDSILHVFGKLGRDTGVKEYNALINICIDRARSTDNVKDSLVHIHRVYQLLASMREGGFQIEEASYGALLMYMIDMGMVEEFEIFSKLLKDENPGSRFRVAYYEMLLCIKGGDGDQICKLCNSLGVSHSDDIYLAESYLLAFCDTDRKEELLQLLEVLDITRVSSLKYVSSIFKSLGRLQLERFAEKFILAFKSTGAQNENISTLIYDYATSIPNLSVEETAYKFNNLHEKLGVVPSSAPCDKLIELCCSLFKVNAALDIADTMCRSGVDVPSATFYTILRASDDNCEPEMVHPIYSMMCRHNVKPNGETFKIMISLCMKMKDFVGAYNFLTHAAETNEKPTTSMYNAIMAGYFRQKNVHGALLVLKQMEDADIRPDSETFSYLIFNCERENDVLKFRDEMQHAGVKVTKHVYMALINAFAKFGNFEAAKQVLLETKLPARHLLEIKCVLISALSANGQISDALNVYDEIRQLDCKIEPKAAISLIENLHSEGQLNRLLQVLEELNDSSYWFDGCSRVIQYCVQYNITMSAVDLLQQLKERDETSAYMVIDQIFCKLWEMEPTNLKLGLELLRSVTEELNLHPSRTSLDFLLSACVKAKDIKSARLIWSGYKSAGLSWNILTFLRMYQVLLASGEKKAASKMLKRISQEDPHVRYIINSCEMAFGKPSSAPEKS